MENKRYVKEVMNHIHTNKKTKKRIQEDLELRLDDSSMDNPYFNPYTDLGNPEEYAKEFMENLEQSGTLTTFMTAPYEYKSKITVFGIPLMHVHTGGRGNPQTARGIIAIGDIANGFISIGGVSAGIISIGGASTGVIAIGGVAMGAVAVGGVALGLYSVGGVAVGLLGNINP